MKLVACKTRCNPIYTQLANVRMSERDRQRAACALHDADAIVDALIWIKVQIAALAALLKPGPGPEARGRT